MITVQSNLILFLSLSLSLFVYHQQHHHHRRRRRQHQHYGQYHHVTEYSKYQMNPFFLYPYTRSR